MPSLVYAISLLLLVPGLCTASTTLLHESKTELFLSAPSFAVVGASDDERKFGTIVRSLLSSCRLTPFVQVFKTMLDQGLDVVPINPFVPESQGIPCLHALSDLADPARTAISVVTPPAVTLEIVRQAHALGVYAVWLQPGAEDAAVLAFIANATANSPTRTSYIHSTAQGLARRSSSPCAIADPDAPDVISTIALRR